MGKKTQSLKIRRMVLLAILTGVVLQLTGFAIKLPFLGTSISLVLIPITLGAMILGPAAGAFWALCSAPRYIRARRAWHGSLHCLSSKTRSPRQASARSSPPAGFLSGLVFRLLRRRKRVAATFTAALVTPVVNTGIFVLGCLLISGTSSGFMQTNNIGGSVVYFLLIGCAGFNFLFEAASILFLPPHWAALAHSCSPLRDSRLNLQAPALIRASLRQTRTMAVAQMPSRLQPLHCAELSNIRKEFFATMSDTAKKTAVRVECPPYQLLCRLTGKARATRDAVRDEIREDVDAVRQRDPAARSDAEILLLYSGVHAILAHRVAHKLYLSGHPLSARTVSQLARFMTGIEIHPAAQIGKGLL